MSSLLTMRFAVIRTARRTSAISRLALAVLPVHRYNTCGINKAEPRPQYNRKGYYLAASIGVALIAAEYVYNGL